MSIIGKVFGKAITAPVRAFAYLVDGVDYVTSAPVGLPRIEASEALHQACDEVEDFCEETLD